MSSNTPKSLYQQILEAQSPSTVQEIIDKENSKRIRVHMPCKVIAVNKNSVDVEIQGQEDTGFGIYSKFPPLLELPIIYNNYTSKAFIITPVQVGDTGLVEFLDFNSTNFQNNGNPVLSSDNFYHSLNNGVFINGFIPNSKQIDIPEGYPIVIGLHNKTFTMSVDNDGNLIIESPTITFNGNININGSVTATGEITGNNIKLSTHKHTGVQTGGGTTGGPV